MTRGMLGRKIGMTQLFKEDGTRVGVTILELADNRILQVKTREKDGYPALQLGVFDKKAKNATRAEIGHAKAGGGPCRFVRELRLEEDSDLAPGATLKMAEIFDGAKKLLVTGVSKGKGFAGVVKRHHFKGLRATHGVKRKHRSPGSIGQHTDPARVFKGKPMAGHMGSVRITQKGVKIVKLLPEKNLMLVTGSVPGANGSFIMIREDLGYIPPVKSK
ncbi:MAG: 50S ribosomal protein L3 [Planctomycetota bacterium]